MFQSVNPTKNRSKSIITDSVITDIDTC